jgi:hypothetical protein
MAERFARARTALLHCSLASLALQFSKRVSKAGFTGAVLARAVLTGGYLFAPSLSAALASALFQCAGLIIAFLASY